MNQCIVSSNENIKKITILLYIWKYYIQYSCHESDKKWLLRKRRRIQVLASRLRFQFAGTQALIRFLSNKKIAEYSKRALNVYIKKGLKLW